MLLMELTGKFGDYFSAFEGSICNMNDLQDVAKLTKDLQLLQSSHVFNVLIEYWRGNYTGAEESSRLASMMVPVSKMPTICESDVVFFPDAHIISHSSLLPLSFA